MGKSMVSCRFSLKSTHWIMRFADLLTGSPCLAASSISARVCVCACACMRLWVYQRASMCNKIFTVHHMSLWPCYPKSLHGPLNAIFIAHDTGLFEVRRCVPPILANCWHVLSPDTGKARASHVYRFKVTSSRNGRPFQGFSKCVDAKLLFKSVQYMFQHCLGYSTLTPPTLSSALRSFPAQCTIFT